MSETKAIIFDLDGTLIPIDTDLIKQLRNCLISTIAKILKISLDEAEDKLDKKLKETFEDDPYLKYGRAALNLIGRKEAKKCFYTAIERQQIFEPEIYDTLKKLKENGVVLTVVSNSSEKRVKNKLKKLKILELVDYISSAEEALFTDKQYPKLEKYKEILEKFNLKPINTYVIGDCYNLDLAPANLLGLNTILILHEKSVVNIALKRESFKKITDIVLSN
ncbi:MAG: HAD family hydrolase [Candidatus Odinarchaeia archaeon]